MNTARLNNDGSNVNACRCFKVLFLQLSVIIRKTYYGTMIIIIVVILIFEGLSGSGKSSTADRLLERHPEWVDMRGSPPTEIGSQNWDEYQDYSMRIRSVMYRKNPRTFFLAERQLSDAVYHHDEDRRMWVKRQAQALPDPKHLFYFTASDSTLSERGSKDMWRSDTLRARYEDLLSLLPYTKINTDDRSIDDGMQIVIDELL